MRAAFLCLILAACTTTERESVPVETNVPVAVNCGPSGVPAAPERPNMDTARIEAETPIDKRADFYRATVQRLLAYILPLEVERDGLRGYEAKCRGGQP